MQLQLQFRFFRTRCSSSSICNCGYSCKSSYSRVDSVLMRISCLHLLVVCSVNLPLVGDRLGEINLWGATLHSPEHIVVFASFRSGYHIFILLWGFAVLQGFMLATPGGIIKFSAVLAITKSKCYLYLEFTLVMSRATIKHNIV